MREWEAEWEKRRERGRGRGREGASERRAVQQDVQQSKGLGRRPRKYIAAAGDVLSKSCADPDLAASGPVVSARCPHGPIACHLCVSPSPAAGGFKEASRERYPIPIALTFHEQTI